MNPLLDPLMSSRPPRSSAAPWFRRVVVALLAVAVGPWPRPAPAWSQETVMFRVDAAHTGVFDEPPLRSYGGLAWRTQTGGAIRSTPAVTDGRLFIGGVDGHVHALDARTGEALWRFRAATAVDASPAVRGGTLYVTDRAGTLYALDAEAGSPRWTVNTGPELPLPWGFESGDLYTSSPTLSGGRVYFGSGDGRVYAVDAASGAVAWSAETGGRVRSTPAVHGGRVYVGSADGVVYAFDAADGGLVWRHETEGAGLDSGDFGYDRRTIQSSPAVADGRLFVGARDGRLYALDTDTGERLWRSPERISWVNGAPAVSNGVVYAATSDQQFVQAVDAATGEELWRVATAGIVWTSPALAGDQVIVAEGAGRVRGLDRETGEERWAAWAGDRLFASPVPAAGLVYVGALDGGVYAFRDGGEAPLARAVFRDSAYVEAGWFSDHEPLARWLVDRGYEPLDAAALESFLEARIADGRPSAVVFALDHVPEAVAAGGRESLFRRYLDAGGTVVWPSLVPLLWRRDPATGASGDFLSIDRVGAGEALSIDVDAVNFDPLGAFSTPAGVALGLPPDGWQTAWTVDAAPGMTALAVDENGRLASWRRGYGGPPGSGLVRLWGARSPVFDPAAAMVAAELRPIGEGR